MPTALPQTNREYWDGYEQHFRKDMMSVAHSFKLEHAGQTEHETGLDVSMAEWATKTIEDMLAFVDNNKASINAEQVLEKLMSTYSDADRKRFLLTNMLEALKKGDPISAVIERYNSIGLTDIRPTTSIPSHLLQNPQRQYGSVLIENADSRIWRLLKMVARLCEPIIKLAVVTLREIAGRTALKVHPIVGVSGIFPTFGVHFELDLETKLEFGKSWEVLSAAFGHPAEVPA
jgi:hypothetical protein